MSNKHQSLVIGCGGIGRSLAVLINDYSRRNLPIFNDTLFVFKDNDEVENENVWTQGFAQSDAALCSPKVAAVTRSLRCNLIAGKQERVENESQLEGYDSIFIAVDNLETRKMVYEYCFKSNKFFIDMRVNGTTFTVLDSTMNREELLSSLEAGEDPGSTSCLFKWEKEQGIVHTTPFVAAGIGLQMWLNHRRKQPNYAVDMTLGGA